MARPGEKIAVLTNSYVVKFHTPKHAHFYSYNVAISFQDGPPVKDERLGRKILNKVLDKHFAYDGKQSLFTVGPFLKEELLQVLLQVSVALEDMPSRRNTNEPTQFNVEIRYVKKIPISFFLGADHQVPEAIRVLDIALRQCAINYESNEGRAPLLVGQTFYPNQKSYYRAQLIRGLNHARGFYSSFRLTQKGLSLILDTSNSMVIVRIGPVANFIVACQRTIEGIVNVPDANGTNLHQLDWNKVALDLMDLRVRPSTSVKEYKIIGLSPNLCKDQRFTWRRKLGDNGGYEEVETTVEQYYRSKHNMDLEYSGDFPCINVGKPDCPIYFPIEICQIVSLQRYKKPLTNDETGCLISKATEKPDDKINWLNIGLMRIKYNDDPVLQASGVSIDSNLTQVDARILQPPMLKVGKDSVHIFQQLKYGKVMDFVPLNGHWNFDDDKVFVIPGKVERGVAVVNFNTLPGTSFLVNDLVQLGIKKGIVMDGSYAYFGEGPEARNLSASARVEMMYERVKSELQYKPGFLLCILPQTRSDIYGHWKKKCLVEWGVATQCIAPEKVHDDPDLWNFNQHLGDNQDLEFDLHPRKYLVTDEYLSNVLLKINVKLGGLNWLLAMEKSLDIMPKVTQVHTMIVGMDVSHGSPGQSDASIAAVVNSREWPFLSKYKATVRLQSAQQELIHNLFNLNPDTGNDEGIFRELLEDFESSSGKKPEHIIIFRDGVSESQFKQVLNIELQQMKEACKYADHEPKFTVIVAQKRNHAKFFRALAQGHDNVLPGTIIDSQICNSHNDDDFYLVAHANNIGTTRPTHYHVLHNEIGFSRDELQELVHSLSYGFQRSTTAISVVAPVRYAHLAAAQMGKIYEVTGAPLPALHDEVATTMFFC